MLYNKRRPEACNFIKKETLAQVFSCEYCEILKNNFLQNTSGRLLLSLAWGSFFLWIVAMSANLRFEGNFFVLKDLLTSNFKVSAELSDEILKTFDERSSFFILN